jgi:pimeloyl-ACP methyl ester carboxylesterase
MMEAEFKDARVRTDGFERHEYIVDGARTVVYSAGQGDPLVFLHGAGTFHGFDFVRGWTDRYRVYVPFHPGFGESDDNSQIDSMHDYLVHYLNLFDQLGLQKFNLVGCSMGGRMAAEFATEHAHRLLSLSLVCPAGLDVPDHPMVDLQAIPPQELISYLINDIGAIAAFLPTGPDPQFVGMRARETRSVGRIMRDGKLTNPKLGRRLHRVRVPTLLLWGADDRLIPAAQAETWHSLLPDATIRIIPNAGHLVLDESATARSAVKEFVMARAARL